MGDAGTDVRLEKNTILSINISSPNPEATTIFNLHNTNYRSSTATGSYTEVGGYLVNSEGNILLPILGKFRAAGITKKELTDNIIDTILARKLLLEPIVDIRVLNYMVTVIGEVSKPTVITVPSEKISLLQAIGLAGDLTIYGKRENVLIIREENGRKITRRVNLNSPDFFNSPYYYLEPNDVVYIEPNRAKVASGSRTEKLIPIILSSVSLIAIIVTRIIHR